MINKSKLIPVAKGWAKNSINTTIFRYNSIVSFNDIQYIAFYNENSQVVIARRKLDSNNWEYQVLKYKGKTNDAHKSISIAVDGNGIIHLAWNHHATRLKYIQIEWKETIKISKKLSMTGKKEFFVTYPEFYHLRNGDLLFFYRHGFSGKGNLILNRYNHETRKWQNISKNLIHGEGKRNAYWQLAIDKNDNIHISWCWRETGNVASNHDLCYAKSLNLGKTWKRSNNREYKLPINQYNAEYVCKIPENHELINTTAMATDSKDNPYIVSYWRSEDSKIPQYNLVYYNGKEWLTQQITQRKTPFSLSGGGTKRIPISRPKIIIDKQDRIYIIFRDVELDEKVSIAACEDLLDNKWSFHNLTDFSVGAWEPTHDPITWRDDNKLHLFVQRVGQGDLETLEDLPPQMVYILEWPPS